MKELEKNRSEELKVSEELPIKKAMVLRREFNAHRGHHVFELNISTGIIVEAEFSEEKNVLVPKYDLLTGKEIGVDSRIVRDVIEKENCIYCTALNFYNADKRFHKMLHKPFKKTKK